MTSPFYDGTPIQFAWNSSALGTFKECARKYQLSYLEGWQQKGSGLHIRFGSLFHAGLEAFDRALVSGDTLDEALDIAVDYLLRSTWDNRGDDNPGEPWATGDGKKNRETLIRSVIWYVDNYGNDPAKTLILADGTAALELSFICELPFLTPRNEPYIITGHIDRMVTYGEDVFVTDRKTTGSTLSPFYFEQYSPDNQMSLYTYAAKIVYSVPVSGVIIDAAQIAVGFTAFSRGITTRSEGQLAEWLRDTEQWFLLAEQYAAVGYWPQNDKSCNDYGGCPFRRVCNKDPAVREHFLRTDFEQNMQASQRILA